jgi:hypothetical protein
VRELGEPERRDRGGFKRLNWRGIRVSRSGADQLPDKANMRENKQLSQ